MTCAHHAECAKHYYYYAYLKHLVKTIVSFYAVTSKHFPYCIYMEHFHPALASERS